MTATELNPRRPKAPARRRAWPVLGGVAVSLTLLLGACGSSSTTTTNTTAGTYTLTVTITGAGGSTAVTVTPASGAGSTYTLVSGGSITGLLGTYTVSVAAKDGYTTPAAQTVDLNSANQAVTFAYSN